MKFCDEKGSGELTHEPAIFTEIAFAEYLKDVV